MESSPQIFFTKEEEHKYQLWKH